MINPSPKGGEWINTVVNQKPVGLLAMHIHCVPQRYTAFLALHLIDPVGTVAPVFPAVICFHSRLN
jgi:hypothetical protein